MSIIQPADLPEILLNAPFSRAIQLTKDRRVYNLKTSAEGFQACVLAESPLPQTAQFQDQAQGIRYECDCPEAQPCLHFWALLVRLFQDRQLQNPQLSAAIALALASANNRKPSASHTRSSATHAFDIDLFGEASLPMAAGIPQPLRNPPPPANKPVPVLARPHNSLFLVRFQTINRPDLWVETAAVPANLLRDDPTESIADGSAAATRCALEASIENSPEKQLSLGSALEQLTRIQPALVCFTTPGRRLALKEIASLEITAVLQQADNLGGSKYHLQLEFQIAGIDSRISAQPQAIATEGGLTYFFARTEDNLLYRQGDPALARILTRIRHLPASLTALDIEQLRLWMAKNPVPNVVLHANPVEQFLYREIGPRAILTLQGSLKRTELFLHFAYDGIECAIHDDGDTLSRVLRDKTTLVIRRRRDLEAAILASLRAITAEMTQFESGLYANLVANRPVADISVVCDLAEFVTRFGLAVMAAGIELRMEGRAIRSGGGLSFRAESDLDWFGFRAGWKPETPATNLGAVSHALMVDEHLDHFGLAGATDPNGEASWIMLGKRDVDRLKLLRKLGMDGNGVIETSPVNVTLIDSLYDQTENKDEIHIQRARDLVRTLGEFTSRHIAASHHDDSAAPVALPEGLLPQPPGLRATLRNYQLLGYNWLAYLHTQKLGGCLADDMGLGKTVQTIALLQSLKEKGELRPSLIIAPVVTLPNWEDELARFAPDLRIHRHAGANRAASLQALISPLDDPARDSQPDLILVSYHTLRNDLDLFVQVNWDYVILDEAHYIKNAGSQIFKAIRVLPSQHRLSLTGTPIENSTMELWSQFSFLNPGLLGTRKRFLSDVASPIERENSEEALGALRDTISPFILRRRKEDVLADLPPKDEILHWCEMAPDQAKLYEEHRSLYRDQIAGILNDKGVEKSGMDIFRCLLRLRQIAINPAMISRKPQDHSGDQDDKANLGSPYSHISSAKMESLRMILDESLLEDHKTLVFSQFVTALKLISRDLTKNGTRHALLTGATVDRRTAVSQFQNDPDLHLFLLSLKAGGVGINLTRADYVVLFDPWWNPAAERQAVDRAHRIGQKRPVLVYKFITRGTIEEKILALQAKKHILAGNLIDGGETGFFHGMNQDEVLDLFGK